VNNIIIGVSIGVLIWALILRIKERNERRKKLFMSYYTILDRQQNDSNCEKKKFVIGEKQTVANNMVKYGGSFARSLGVALNRADSENTYKIHKAWPELWERYLNMGKENKK